MKLHLPHFADRLRASIARDHHQLDEDFLDQLFERGKQWDLSSTLRSGGAVSFPHAKLRFCGHQIAAAVTAALDCGADQLLVLGVLHPLSNELWNERGRMQCGEDVFSSPVRGIQGGGRNTRQEWRGEYSLASFFSLLEAESRRRGVHTPKLFARYPFLAAGHPETLPGIGELEQLARDSAILATGDLMHHGAIYGDDPTSCIPLGSDAEELARTQIEAGFSLLSSPDYDAYRAHSFATRSDAQDVGQVLRHILGPFTATIHDLVCCDTTALYDFPPPNWVAAPLIEIKD